MVTHLGRFELSLTTTDLPAMRDFYLALGFAITGGKPEEGWLELTAGELRVGIYQGHIAANQASFFGDSIEHVADILRAKGLHSGLAMDERDGTRSITITDPEGNPIYFNCAG